MAVRAMPNILYLFFTKSINADVADMVQRTLAKFDGKPAKNMADYIRDFALPMLDDNTTLIIRELNQVVA